MNPNEYPPLLTVVVPVRDRADIVTTTLDSIAAQDLRPLRLIIVDNGSTDRTPEVLARWTDAHRTDDFDITVVNEPVAGAARARNQGLKEVMTDYVLFFDSDDVMEHDHLSRIVSTLDSHPEIDILYWSIAFRDNDGWTTVKEAPPSDTDLLQSQILHSILGTQRYCIRTSTLRAVGAWNETLTTWDDYELGIRLLCAHPASTAACLNGTPRVIVNITPDSLTGPTFSSRADAQAIAIRAIAPLLEHSERHKLLFHAKQAVLAANYLREGSRELSHATLAATLAPYSGSVHRKLKLIFAVQRLAGRGGSSLAAAMFRDASPTAIHRQQNGHNG